MALNLASKYSKKVDERWLEQSQAALALGNEYDFVGVESVNVYSFPTVPMTDYKRTGENRYGEATELVCNVQTMKITQDKGFTFTIDKGNYTQSMMLEKAGQRLSRQINEVAIPMYDTYVFKTLAAAAVERGATSDAAIDEKNAYSSFLDGMEWIGNHGVPVKGCVAFCSYKFYNFLKKDSSFVRYGDKSQDMLNRGVMGDVDGCKIVRVGSDKLPAGCAFLIVHPSAACGPKQLEDYKIHDNPPGISGWKIEGRIIFDCFVLNEKAEGLYYHGSQAALKNLVVATAATNVGKSTIIVHAAMEGAKRYYMTAATAGGLTAVTHGTAITTNNWTELTGAAVEITPTGTHKFIRVVEVDAANKPIAVGTKNLNIG